MNTFLLLRITLRLLLVALLVNCTGKSSKEQINEVKETRYVHDPDGNLKSRFDIVDGKVHGEAVTYYPGGKISTVVKYERNKKEGIEKKYYSSGQLYRTRPYENGKLSGIEKRYYKDGGIKTIQEFRLNNPASELIEYTPGGRIITDYPTILFSITKERDYAEQVLLLFRMSDGSKNVQFYKGKLIRNKYFDQQAELELSNNGIGEIWIEPDYTGSIFISAKVVRESRGLYVTQARVKLQHGVIREISN